MKIQLSIRRPGGSTVTLPHPQSGREVAYHFQPTLGDPRHTAEVKIAAHAQTLLSIKEYTLADGNDDDGPDDEDQVDTEAKTDPVIAAPVSTKTDAEVTASQIKQAGEAAKELGPKPEVKPTTSVKSLEDMTRDELAAIYEAEIGKKPHPSSHPETLAERIKEHRAASADA
ncbi:hypothetical protein JI664_21445 [Rhodobacter sp. NTK016B]|uniref:hypothetical protein n=1 Tax=Rhodobacter sp. NTK016B TaxID=2759676 RepID=UPI001A90041E|nr:hypothetical protein [Rhodobacter sp. NTK016B]MBN8294552.1 hypothetical protein [Rhodobacter sp. NTK016B]